MEKIDRLEFLRLAGAVLGAGAATLIAACGGDDTSSAGGGAAAACSATAPVATISQNHGHTLTIPGADVTAAAAKKYTTGGTATHTHDVNVSAANFQSLAGGKSFSVTSEAGGTDGHTHAITVC